MPTTSSHPTNPSEQGRTALVVALLAALAVISSCSSDPTPDSPNSNSPSHNLPDPPSTDPSEQGQADGAAIGAQFPSVVESEFHLTLEQAQDAIKGSPLCYKAQTSSTQFLISVIIAADPKIAQALADAVVRLHGWEGITPERSFQSETEKAAYRAAFAKSFRTASVQRFNSSKIFGNLSTLQIESERNPNSQGVPTGPHGESPAEYFCTGYAVKAIISILANVTTFVGLIPDLSTTAQASPTGWKDLRTPGFGVPSISWNTKPRYQALTRARTGASHNGPAPTHRGSHAARL